MSLTPGFIWNDGKCTNMNNKMHSGRLLFGKFLHGLVNTPRANSLADFGRPTD